MANPQRPNLQFNGLDPAIIVQALQQQQQVALQKEQQANQQKQQGFNNLMNAAKTGFSLASQAQDMAEKKRKTGATDKIVELLQQDTNAQIAQQQQFTAPQPSTQVDPLNIPIRGEDGQPAQASLQSPIQQFQAPQAPVGSPAADQVSQNIQALQQNSRLNQARIQSGETFTSVVPQQKVQDTLSAAAAQQIGSPELAGLEEDEAKFVLDVNAKKERSQAEERQRKEDTEQKVTEESIKNSKDLRKEFTARSKDYFTTRDSVSRIRSIASQKPSAAGDLAFIFNFMKVQDPGSVVRESEFRNAAGARSWVARTEANGRPIPAKIKQIIQKLDENQQGAFMLPSQRKDFLDTANNSFKPMQRQHRKREKEFKRIARKIKADPEQVIIDFNPTQEATPNQSPRTVTVGNRAFKIRRKK